MKYLHSKLSSIQLRLIAVFSVVILVSVFVITGLSSRLYRESLYEAADRHSLELLQTINSAIRSYLVEYSDVARNAFLSKNMHNILYDSEQSGLSRTERAALFQQYQTDVLGYRRNLNQIYAVSNDGSVFPAVGHASQLSEPVTSYEWYQRVFEADGGTIVDSGTSWLDSVYPNSHPVISVARLMKRVNPGTSANDYAVLGALIFELSPDFLRELLKDTLSDSTHLIITDGDGNVLYDSESRQYGAYVSDLYPLCAFRDGMPVFQEGGDASCFYHTCCLDYGWSAFLITETSSVSHQSRQFLQSLAILAVTIVIVTMILSLVISKSIIRPMQVIQQNIALLQSGDLSGRITGQFPTELRGIVRSYNEMMDNLETLLEENYVAKIETLESKYSALQAQMNPHFIYNILEIINCHLTIIGQQETAKTVRSLAKLIRYNMRIDTETTLEADVQNLHNYCRLLQEVYRDFKSYEIHMPPELGVCKLPCFTLQPMVENAVIHGLKNLDYPGKLIITASAAENDLLISICDNGVGIPPAQLSQIQQQLTTPFSFQQTDSGSSIGILNVHHRLVLKYGHRYGVTLRSQVGQGTEVILCLPRPQASE